VRPAEGQPQPPRVRAPASSEYMSDGRSFPLIEFSSSLTLFYSCRKLSRLLSPTNHRRSHLLVMVQRGGDPLVSTHSTIIALRRHMRLEYGRYFHSPNHTMGSSPGEADQPFLPITRPRAREGQIGACRALHRAIKANLRPA
jgi:hypothetical protein